MEYKNIKGLITPVSRISFGTATSTLEKEDEIHAMLDYYVERGGNYIDTARFYGRGSGIQHTEELLSRWLEKDGNREKVVIQSKCCNTYISKKGTYNDIFRVSRAHMYDDIMFSRDHLGVDCIDLYLMHRDDPSVPVSELMDTFEEFKLKGWIKAYGMSNWTLDRFIEACEYCERMAYQGPSVYSPFFSLMEIKTPWYHRIPPFKDEWLPWFEEHTEILLAAWAAQGRGFFGNYPQYDPEKADAATKAAVLGNPENFLRKERAVKLGEMKGIRPSQISLQYVLSQKASTAAIIGPRSVVDIDHALNAMEDRLTQQEIDYLTLKQDSLD